jgi:pimeloyl-ACP methyl ester carboxylesterase
MSASVRLHVETQGTGPVVVFAHGFGGSARNFRVQAKALRDVCQVVLYDARGHARSEAPADADAYAFERLVDDFERIADQTGAERVVAGGLSMGAATALAFARRRPERIAGLVLASLPNPNARREWATGFAAALDAEGAEAAGAKFVWGETSRFDPAGAKLIRLGFLEHPPHAMAALLRHTLAVLPDPAELAAPLAVQSLPALVIAGAEDRGSIEPCERVAHVLPDAELVIVPGAGHVVNLSAPAVFNEHVKTLLARMR